MLYNREAKYFPTGQLTSTGPYNFRIPSENGLMIDTATIRLEGMLKVVKVLANGTEQALTSADNVLLVNMFPAALFRSIEVSLNGTMVSYVSSPAAHYRAMIESALSYGHDATATHLKASRFYLDEPDKFDKVVLSQLGDEAKTRHGLTSLSKIVDFCTPLHSGNI
jgi:hypothetical protein